MQSNGVHFLPGPARLQHSLAVSWQTVIAVAGKAQA